MSFLLLHCVYDFLLLFIIVLVLVYLPIMCSVVSAVEYLADSLLFDLFISYTVSIVDVVVFNKR